MDCAKSILSLSNIMNQLPDIRQLRIFLALENSRSFTGAASQLQITQSADHAEQAVKQLENAYTKIKTLNEWGYSSIKIGASNTLCQYVIPKALHNFYDKEKRCEIFITSDDTKGLAKKIYNGELDIAFGVHLNSLENDYKFIPIASDELCFATSPEHQWCDTPPESSEDFEKERFIIYGNDSVTQNILSTHLPGIGIRQRSSLAMNNMESIKEMAALGIGVGIITPWIARSEFKEKSLISHPITPAPKREWGYYISKSKALSLPEEAFVRSFSKELKDIIG